MEKDFHHEDSLQKFNASYDIIGVYHQDAVNGFDNHFLDKFVQICKIKSGEKILDAMAGDGNLAERILKHHSEVKITSADLSSIQCLEAEKKLKGKVVVKNIDLVNQHIFHHEFDLVVVKSGSHEIPLENQALLYKGIFKALKSGGRFINLGILIDSEECRNEIGILNRYRSELAGVPQDVKGRHFLLRSEFYNALYAAGFEQVSNLMSFNYKIDMGVLANQYLKGNTEKRITMNGVVTELKELRKNYLAVLEDNWVVRMPGEITWALKN